MNSSRLVLKARVNAAICVLTPNVLVLIFLLILVFVDFSFYIKETIDCRAFVPMLVQAQQCAIYAAACHVLLLVSDRV